jgi:hypothetical protein
LIGSANAASLKTLVSHITVMPKSPNSGNMDADSDRQDEYAQIILRTATISGPVIANALQRHIIFFLNLKGESHEKVCEIMT